MHLVDLAFVSAKAVCIGKCSHWEADGALEFCSVLPLSFPVHRFRKKAVVLEDRNIGLLGEAWMYFSF